MKKKLEIKNLQEKTDKALYQELIDLNKKLTELKFKQSFRKLKNYHEITFARKKTARILTILNLRIRQKLLREKNK